MISINNNPGYNKLLSFQKGGNVSTIDKKKKEELFPYFAYLYSKELNPKKYGSITSMKEWIKIIQNSKEDVDEIIKAAAQLNDEDWNSLAEQYQKEQLNNQEQLQFVKKGGKIKSKKCSCGCDLILSKEEGGKLTQKCACNCKGNKMRKKK